MNRQSKYRGKAVETGEMVYGSLVNNLFFNSTTKEPVCYIIDPNQFEEYDSFEDIERLAVEVDPKTVGQYTGVQSDDGKEIYEGDIVTFGNGSIRNIKYDRGSFTMFDGESRRSPLSDCVVERTIEVIGNIWENPELLEG